MYEYLNSFMDNMVSLLSAFLIMKISSENDITLYSLTLNLEQNFTSKAGTLV